MTRKECLTAAIDAVCKDRENTYGSPEDNFKLIADLWSTYTGAKIGPQDVAVMMILLKTARAKNSNHDDNFVDIAGYAACAAEIGEPEKAIKIVENWSKEHSIRTRQSEFLKQYPNAVLEKGVLAVRPCDLDSDIECPDRDERCYSCKEIYWLKEIGE